MTELTFSKRDGSLITTQISEQDYLEATELPFVMAGGKGASGGKYVKIASGGPYLHRWVAHRMGLLATTDPEVSKGKWVTSIDHVNGDKLDNRRENLRVLDRPQQMRNANDKPRSTNRSGYRGVSFVARRERYGKPWMAYVTVNYKTINLGWYATVEEAAAARAKWDADHVT